MDDRAAWAQQLLSATTPRAAELLRICELCVTSLGVTGAGISMVTDLGNRAVVCATDEVSTRIEELQVTLGEGPCFDAFESGAPVLVADLEEPEDLVVGRWPGFMESAAAAGVRAVFAFPLRIGALGIGAMDLYRVVPGGLDAGQLPAALMAADVAALALLDLRGSEELGWTDALATADSYPFQVHQATGMTQVQLGVTTQEAFLRLRAHAFATGRPLADVADDVVHRRYRFSEEDA